MKAGLQIWSETGMVWSWWGKRQLVRPVRLELIVVRLGRREGEGKVKGVEGSETAPARIRGVHRYERSCNASSRPIMAFIC